MKLTYRGINYKAQKQETKSDSLENAIGESQAIGIPLDQHLTDNIEKNKVIQIKPIHYYAYRGVSYTKNLVFDGNTKVLLDIDRK